jgi:hypothetical protein
MLYDISGEICLISEAKQETHKNLLVSILCFVVELRACVT